MADRNRRAEGAEAQTLAAAALASAVEARVAAAAEVPAIAVEEAQIRAEAESTKWHGVSRKFFDSFGFPGDVVTKGPDLRRVYEETGGCVGSEGPTNAGGL